MNEWSLSQFKDQCDSINSQLSNVQLPNVLVFDSEIKKNILTILKAKEEIKIVFAGVYYSFAKNVPAG